MKRPTLLLAANYDSAVGYAWWLMESYWAALAERYSRTHEVILVYPSISTVPQAIREAPLTPVLGDFTGTGFRAVLEQFMLLLRHRVRCIYLTDQETLHWRYLVFRLAGVRRVIVHDHTPGLRIAPQGLKQALKRLAHTLPWVTVDGSIGATPFVRQRHIEVACLPASKCYVAANGLREPSDAIAPTDARARFGIPANRRILVATGRAHHVKGIAFALDCMNRLVHVKGRTDVHLLHCGDGPHLQEFRERAQRLELLEYVTLAGRQADVTALLPSCDIAFHPSQAEVGYSLSILEYMQAALPVVVPDNPSVCGATIHEKTGLHYASGSVEAAAAAIESLLDDPAAARELGRTGRNIVLKEYTLNRAHEALLDAFRAVDPQFPA